MGHDTESSKSRYPSKNQNSVDSNGIRKRTGIITPPRRLSDADVLAKRREGSVKYEFSTEDHDMCLRHTYPQFQQRVMNDVGNEEV